MPRLPRGTTLCVCVPTYNEADNLEPFADAVLAEFDRLDCGAVLLIIDDNSPDGTGAIADRLARRDRRVFVLHRARKAGIGNAYKAGFAWTRRHRSIRSVVQMDCDFSHAPADLGRLLAAREQADVVIGSRYVPGGRVVDWPWWRRAISRGGSWYARTVLGVAPRDLTGGYKCFGPGALARIPLDEVSASGYGFQIETTWRALQAGLQVTEVPITFRDRTQGSSKMSLAIAREAALMVPRLRWGPPLRGIRAVPPAAAARMRRAAARVQQAVVATPHATVGLLRTAPRAALGAAGTAATVAALAVVTSAAAVLHGALAIEFVLTTAVGLSTVTLMLYAWRDGESETATRFGDDARPPRHAFSLIVPARHEEEVLAATLHQLAAQRHPDFEVLVVVGDDDPGTHEVAREAVGDDERFRILVDHHPVKNKPRALNTALTACRGDVVGVFDAEDQVAPGLLDAVDRRFQQTGADVVQGPVQLMNYGTSWFSVRNVLEYYFWFKSRLHFHAEQGFIPLGGNTVFIRRHWLESTGGWDGDCLAEDCELGARLSARGAQTVVAFSPEHATREETPGTVRELLKQRTRWNQGFLQVLRKREWRHGGRRARALALYTLSFPILQALMGLSIPLALVTLALKLPILLALLSFLPVLPLASILVAELIGLTLFCREFSLPARPRDYVRLLVGCVPYQLLLCVAAVRAGWRELHGITNWEKTAHVGAHL